MSNLSFELGRLFTEAVSALVPAEKHKDFTEAQNIFNNWTSDSSSKIYSGYRKACLESSDTSYLNKVIKDLRAISDHLLVCGIGGSSLGAQSALTALGNNRKVFFLDNLDTFYFERLLHTLPIERTSLLIVSKSGGTIESMLNAFRVLETYKKSKIDSQKRTVVVTTKGKGILFEWAMQENFPTYFIPEEIGGRFSLMTPAGLIPIGFAGHNIQEFVEGAKTEYLSPHSDLWKLAARIEEFEKGGFRILTLWPYANILFEWGRWFQQLWGESLGKKLSNTRSVGMFPAACVGANDQHSLLQFLMEGSPYCLNAFISIKSFKSTQDWKVSLPAQFRAKLGFSEGRLYSEVLAAEAEATQKALERVGRPSFKIEIPELNERSLGALYASAMDLTVMVGVLKQINPFDQPGVETGKIILEEILKS